MFYRTYRGVAVAEIEANKKAAFNEITVPRLLKEAQAEIRQHLAKGTQVVLITGTLPYIVEPLAEHLNLRDVICTILEEDAGYFTGKIVGMPISDKHRAKIIKKFAQENGIDLQSSFAYGDSMSDCQMLRAVGNPVVVNPGFRLQREASRRGWQIKYWTL